MTTKEFAKNIRKAILEQAMRAQVGHIGSALSITDIIAVLYNKILRKPGTNDFQRDRFVLSKGHAALALYAALCLKGVFPKNILETYCADNSFLGVHPEHMLEGVDFSTGSLGQGISFAAGAALAARLQNSTRRVFVVVSDAECNEGVLWETVAFAAHHRLSNLIVIVDTNGQQAFGYTSEVLDLEPLAKKWEIFGWDAQEIDGHDTAKLSSVLEAFETTSGKPHVLIAKTIFGKGVSDMHGKIKWHYLPMSAQDYKTAIAEIETNDAH